MSIFTYFLIQSKYKSALYYRNDFLSNVDKIQNLPSIMYKGHISSITDYINMKDYYLNEKSKGILDLRYNLLDNAEGTILETCCGVFPNAICYNKDKVSSIVAIDWSNELLELAYLSNKKVNTVFMNMNAADLEFIDNAFDTVVDTFGLNSTPYLSKQWSEMKRVCKKGGKILLLEFGYSYWASNNYKMINKANNQLHESGQILIRDWDKLILNDPEVEVIKAKRRINGKIYYYELRKK